MGDQRRPLQPGETAPAFELARANFEGMVSFADLSGRPFVIGFFRGLHCPFCRRQLVQLAGVQPTLRAAGVETVAVINTPVERASLYFRYRPTPVTMLCDPDCRTHQAYGVPHAAFLPDGSASSPNGPIARRWRSSRRRGSTPRASCRNRYTRWKATRYSTPRTASSSKTPIMRSSQTTLPSSSGTSWSMRTAPSAGHKSRRSTDPNSLSIFPTAAEIIIAAAGSLGR